MRHPKVSPALVFEYRGVARLAERALQHRLHLNGGMLEEIYSRAVRAKRAYGQRLVLAKTADQGRYVGAVWVGAKSPEELLRPVHIYVKPGYRGRGIASQLLLALERHHGIVSAQLYTHSFHTPALKRFWQRQRVFLMPQVYTVPEQYLKDGGLDPQCLSAFVQECVYNPQREHLRRYGLLSEAKVRESLRK